ncbi:MAG: hypothetical protein IJN60_06755 [Oscillospiraceae bacterium]|nr:hypothetical protein [Oscillospiraceae bacterium]
MHAIGIDLGTTSICGVLMDTQTGRVLRSRTQNSNAFIAGEYFERKQSPEKIISLAREILEDLLDDQTQAIGVTGQMHGIVYYDAAGKAVSPLYTWQDGRGNLPFGDTTYALYLRSHSGYGHVTDFYNRVNGLVPENAVGYCTIHDYLVMQLCGLTQATIHVSNAASFGRFDLQTGRTTYDCRQTVVADYRVAGTYKGICVGVAIGDNQASVFSSLADPDSVLVNVGTGSQVSVISDEILQGPGIETRPYMEGKYLAVGSALCGGRAYAVLKDFYKALLNTDDDAVYARMSQLLEGVDGTTLQVDTRFSGSREDETLRGSITGISTRNFTPAELTYGFLEGMIGELYRLYQIMGVQRTGLIASGNGIRKNTALQKVAERYFGAKLRIPEHKEEAAYGAALFALVAGGFYESARDVQRLIRLKG